MRRIISIMSSISQDHEGKKYAPPHEVKRVLTIRLPFLRQQQTQHQDKGLGPPMKFTAIF